LLDFLCRYTHPPSHSTFKACVDDKEISKAMGPVVKCGAVPQTQRTNAVWPLAHTFCLDAEPTQAQWGAAKAAWDKQTADDKAAAAKKAADDARKAAAANAAGAAAAAQVTLPFVQAVPPLPLSMLRFLHREENCFYHREGSCLCHHVSHSMHVHMATRVPHPAELACLAKACVRRN
jgi:hypothetical protein